MRLRTLALRLPLPRRPRFQYGLRSLLLLMLVVCLGLGWYVERVRRQRRAVALLADVRAIAEYYDSHYGEPGFHRKVANDISVFESPTRVSERVESLLPTRLRDALGVDFFRPVDSLVLFEAVPECCRDLPGVRHAAFPHRVVDEDLINIGALRDLKRLLIVDSCVSDAGMKLITQCRKLKCLEIACWHSWLPSEGGQHYWRWHQPITDAGLAPLADLRQLKQLTLRGAAVSGAGLSCLSSMPDLEVLQLNSTKLTDEGLTHLTGLRRLRLVDLSDTAVGDAGLACLANLPNLDVLDLSRTLVTDKCLPTIRSLPFLRLLCLKGTAITDNGLGILGELSSLKRLERIDIAGTAVSKEGAAWLKERLPDVTIIFSESADLPLRRAHRLMRAGLWRQALEALRKLDRSYQEPDRSYGEVIGRLTDIGRCHAELREWEQAEEAYFQAIEKYERCRLWEELDDWPRLYERLARRRPTSVERWLTSARMAVLEGEWSTAADDFARAFELSSGFDKCPDNRRCEYGASRLLVGDLAGHRRFCSQLLEAHKRTTADQSEGPASVTLDRTGMDFAVKRMWFFAPQGTADPYHLLAWCQDESTDLEQFSDVLPLMYCRAGRFEKTLEHDKSEFGGNWFSCALAHHYLGHQAQARECLERGTQELNRRRKIARIRGDFHDAGYILEAEVLRREAEKLVIKGRAESR